MKHLGAKTARLWRNMTSFARGLVTGAILVIALNSYGHVIQVGIVPNTIQMTAEAMK